MQKENDDFWWIFIDTGNLGIQGLLDERNFRILEKNIWKIEKWKNGTFWNFGKMEH